MAPSSNPFKSHDQIAHTQHSPPINPEYYKSIEVAI